MTCSLGAKMLVLHVFYFVTVGSVIKNVWKCLSFACFSTSISSFPLKSEASF